MADVRSSAVQLRPRRARILVAASGCEAAASKFTQLCQLFTRWADVIAITTKTAEMFTKDMPANVIYYKDGDDWSTWRKIGDPVLHIQLSQWADIMVIAPLSANTLAKIANGLCDNLLTCTVRAWDYGKQIFVAPCMSRTMWDNMLTEKHLGVVDDLGMNMIRPDNGAMAEVDFIYSTVSRFYQMKFQGI